MPKSLKIELTSAIIVAGFFLAVVFHYVMAFYFDEHYILNTFLFNPSHQEFTDFFSNYRSSKNLSPYTSEHLSSYFPTAYLVFYPFALINRHLSSTLYCAATLFILGFFCKYYFKPDSKAAINSRENRYVCIKNVLIFSLMTFPALFAFERGNLESMLFVFLLFSMFFYNRKQYLISALLLAFPISMKIYPAVFLVLFFSDKHFKEIVICILSACILTWGSLLIFNGTIYDQLISLAETMQMFGATYIGNTRELPFNLSYYGFYQTIYATLQHISWGDSLPFYQSFLHRYAIFCFICFGIIAACIIFFKMPFWKKIALLVSSMIVFPYISYDYKLLHIYLPFFFFVNTRPETCKRDLKYVIIFSLLFIPKNYMKVYHEVSIATLVDNLLLTTLILFTLMDCVFSKKKSLVKTQENTVV